MAKSKSTAGDEFLETIGDSISDAASAGVGMLTGRETMSSREYKLEKERIKAEALTAEAEAERDAALYDALSGKSQASASIRQASPSVGRMVPAVASAKPGSAFRVRKALKGAGLGLLAGGALGSVVPGIGTIVGAIGGAITGGIAADSLS